MKKGIRFVTLFSLLSLCACATAEQEISLRQLEMEHALEIARINASMPRAILYESVSPEGVRTVVYAPPTASNGVRTQYVPRPLPKADLSMLYPFVTLLSAITGQYYGFRTTEAMYNFLGKQTPSSSSYYSDSSTHTADNSTSSADTTSVTKTRYGDYSGNAGTGSDSSTSTVVTGNTVTDYKDSNNTTDSSTNSFTYTEQTQVIPPVINNVPVVITPVVVEGSSD